MRSKDPWQRAEAAFKAATTKPAEPPPTAKRPVLPNAKEQVSLRLDRDVLDHFQEAGPGWQERINEALRRAAGLSGGWSSVACVPIPIVLVSALPPEKRRGNEDTP